MTLCSPSLEVKAPLSCSVTANTVDYGGKFKFTGKTATSSCHNCKLYRGNNEHTYIDNQSNIENYEITFDWWDPKTFTYECQCDNMDASANKCSKTVDTQVNPPTFACKTGLKATIDESNNVTIGLENVVGCHEGGTWCKYSITGTDISEKIGTGISNGSVNLGAFTDNGTDGSSKNYTVTLENSAGVGGAQTCSVEFTAGSTPDYCSGKTPVVAHASCSSNSFNYALNTTESVCLKIHGNIGGWGCSNCNGRTWKVNGGSSTTSTASVTATADGYSYIDISAGSLSYAQPYGYNISCP